MTRIKIIMHIFVNDKTAFNENYLPTNAKCFLLSICRKFLSGHNYVLKMNLWFPTVNFVLKETFYSETNVLKSATFTFVH